MTRVWNGRLALLSAAHFTIDGYSSFLAPLLPLLVTRLHLSLGQVGVLVALASCAGSLSQPLFGAWSDRLERPWFVLLGPLVTAAFMTSIGLAPRFAALVALVMAAGLGSAAFHPQSAMLVARSPRAGSAMSIFVTAGTLGLTVGPLVAVAIAGAVGLERLWYAALPGVVVTALTLAGFTRLPVAAVRASARPRWTELAHVARPLALIYGCTVFRTMVSYGFQVFVPIMLHREGASVRTGGVVIAAFLAGGGVGGLVGGWAAERWSPRTVLIASFALGWPMYAAFVWLRGPLAVAALVLGQLALQLSLPVNVLMGQALSPRHASTIASLLMGAAWGMGQLLAAPTGVLGDAIGLRSALLVLTTIMALGLACAWALPASAAPDDDSADGTSVAEAMAVQPITTAPR